MRPSRSAVLVGAALVALALIVGGLVRGLTGPDESPAPATKKAIAAVTVDVLGIEPSSYEVNPLFDVPEPLGVEIRWHPGGDPDAHYLHVDVRTSPGDAAPRACPDTYDCATWDGDDGAYRLQWQEEAPEEDPGILTLSHVADGELRSVTYAGEEIRGDPRELDALPESIDDLERLLSDPRLSSTTTQAMVDADLAKWPAEDDAGDAVPTTPSVVAQWLLQDGVTRPADGGRPADVSEYAEGSVGVELRSPDRTTSVVLVPADSDRLPTCGAGWHCRTERSWTGKVVTGWRRGEAITIRRSDDAVVLGSVRSASIVDGLPRPAWRFGRAGQDFDALTDGYAAMNLETTRAFAAGAGPRWFHGP